MNDTGTNATSAPSMTSAAGTIGIQCYLVVIAVVALYWAIIKLVHLRLLKSTTSASLACGLVFIIISASILVTRIISTDEWAYIIPVIIEMLTTNLIISYWTNYLATEITKRHRHWRYITAMIFMGIFLFICSVAALVLSYYSATNSAMYLQLLPLVVGVIIIVAPIVILSASSIGKLPKTLDRLKRRVRILAIVLTVAWSVHIALISIHFACLMRGNITATIIEEFIDATIYGLILYILLMMCDPERNIISLSRDVIVGRLVPPDHGSDETSDGSGGTPSSGPSTVTSSSIRSEGKISSTELRLGTTE